MDKVNDDNTAYHFFFFKSIHAKHLHSALQLRLEKKRKKKKEKKKEQRFNIHLQKAHSKVQPDMLGGLYYCVVNNV